MAQPDILTIPFAANAAPETINPIPISREPTDPAQQATWSEGFPRVTMQPMATGGIPPKGQDMNGALKAISEHIVYMGSGGLYGWSDAWVAAKGGYPLGAVLQSNDGRSAYVNIVEGNAVNFNTTPSSIGVSWLPFAGNGALSGKVDKTTQVIAGGGLTGGGALGENRTLAIGTPSTLSGSTANTVTEDSHTHAVEAATESVAGVARIATTAQAQALVDDATVITPKKLGDVTATETRRGIIEIATAAEAQALVNDTHALTPKKLGDAMNAHVLGMGQTWQDMTASRSLGVTYTNTTGKTIMFSIDFEDGTGTNTVFVEVDGTTISRNIYDRDPVVGSYANSFLVPPASTYKVRITGNGKLVFWSELR